SADSAFQTRRPEQVSLAFAYMSIRKTINRLTNRMGRFLQNVTCQAIVSMRRALWAQDYACFTAVAVWISERTTHKASRSFPTERTASERIADSYRRMATGEMSARKLNDRLHTSPYA
ncbi:hypothetical protein, partial [Paraburkholderia dipogonis]|uniref:hypothetical protein n=1 Tax=Paraburkholderia dipogonis TaxID=1211383 RepID=UPI001AD810E4